MKYIVCETPGKFLLKEKEAPVQAKGEALLRIKKVGICGTDLVLQPGVTILCISDVTLEGKEAF